MAGKAENIMLSFVIPCYKSSLTLEYVVNEIVQTVAEHYAYEIILVNDASPDNTLDVINRLCANNNHIKGINFSRNFGQHSALMAGYNFTKGDIIISMDDDGQTPAKESLKLIEPLLTGDYDIAIAKYADKRHSLFKKFGSKVNDIMAIFMLNKPKDLYTSSFLAYKRFIIEEIVQYKNPYPYLEGLILRTTLNIANVDINHRDRIEGKSNYTLKKLLSLWLNGFTAFSVKPLRIASIIGVFLASSGFIYTLYIIMRKLLYPKVSMGWSSLMAIQLIIGGTTLCVLGLIGEYIGRIYISLNKSPQYVIKELINIDNERKE